MIGGHFFPQSIVSPAYPEYLRTFFLRLFLNGRYGVTCFFFISGFLITRILAGSHGDFSKTDLKIFYTRRAGRILPLLFLTVLVGTYFHYFPLSLGEHMKLYDVWKLEPGPGWSFWTSLFTFTFNWFLILKANTSSIGIYWTLLWSLAVEEQFYLLYPLVTKNLGNHKKIILFLSLVVFSAILFRGVVFWVKGDDVNWGATASFAAFDQIAVGGLFYFLWKKTGFELKSRLGLAWTFLFLGLGIIGTLFGLTSFDNGAQRILVPTLLASGCGLFVLGGMALPAFTRSFWRLVSWPGHLSYGCYLWHPTLMFLLMPFLAWIRDLPAFFLLLAAVVFFSYFSFSWFEQPFNFRIRSYFKANSLKAS